MCYNSFGQIMYNQNAQYMKRILLTIMVVFCSCKKEDPRSPIKLCTELYSEPADTMAAAMPEAAGLSALFWKPSPRFPLNISVKFMNGTEFQKQKVMQYARLWTTASAPGSDSEFQKPFKVNFSFLPYDGATSGNVANIRIFFHQGGSSSYIGTDCKNISQDKPTMYFGWVDEQHSEEEIKQVVLHEFGHALGMIHEHQHPAASIPWDKPKVYAHYWQTQRPPWDQAKVDANIFYRYSHSSVNATQYDPTSIMHYAIPASLTVGGYSTPWNSNLSSHDVAFIKAIYPYNPCTVNEDCCFDKKTGKEILCP